MSVIIITRSKKIDSAEEEELPQRARAGKTKRTFLFVVRSNIPTQERGMGGNLALSCLLNEKEREASLAVVVVAGTFEKAIKQCTLEKRGVGGGGGVSLLWRRLWRDAYAATTHHRAAWKRMGTGARAQQSP